MVLLDICICTIIFLVGVNLKNFFSGFSNIEKRWLTGLFFFHFFIAVVFHFYIATNGGDAIKYWMLPKNGTFDDVWFLVVNQRASSFIYFFNYFPSNVLDLSMFTGNMLYALVGYTAFIYWFKIFKSLFPNGVILNGLTLFRVPLFPLLLFLPNLHFWSSGIGKDAILFFCISIFLYALLDIKKRLGLMGVSILLSLLIRPHITLFLLLAFSLGYLIDGRLKVYQKIAVFLVLAIGFASIFNYVVQFIQLESLEVSSVEEFASTRVSNLSEQRTESGVDISAYPFPLKVFTFLYRPLFFDIIGVFAILSSFENVILLLFTVTVLVNKPIIAFRKGSYILKGAIIFFIMGSVSFSLILGNLGIMLRQKNMFIPGFLLFGIWVLYYRKLHKLQSV
ncbi:hypothetical protein [Altibacter sp.]|uniref:hypothetical protein n=1 Tax=Altibacter sp. TaxID=2024823 RepID=UPI000C8C4D96|nr:hypothetical protein [Altibacter sp.]MAP55562.1 hypothetical protein [Altibacter sp.]